MNSEAQFLKRQNQALLERLAVMTEFTSHLGNVACAHAFDAGVEIALLQAKLLTLCIVSVEAK